MKDVGLPIQGQFSPQVAEHSEQPRNYGPLSRFNGHARITGSCGDAMEFWKQWPNIAAAKRERLIALDAALISMPGPALDNALLLLAKTLWGDEIEALMGEGAH